LKDVPKKNISVDAAMINSPARKCTFFALHLSAKTPTNTEKTVRKYSQLGILSSYREQPTRLPHILRGE
jgi:hypothetical protein